VTLVTKEGELRIQQRIQSGGDVCGESTAGDRNQAPLPLVYTTVPLANYVGPFRPGSTQTIHQCVL
jgi:hypothetical protein